MPSFAFICLHASRGSPKWRPRQGAPAVGSVPASGSAPALPDPRQGIHKKCSTLPACLFLVHGLGACLVHLVHVWCMLGASTCTKKNGLPMCFHAVWCTWCIKNSLYRRTRNHSSTARPFFSLSPFYLFSIKLKKRCTKCTKTAKTAWLRGFVWCISWCITPKNMHQNMHQNAPKTTYS